MIYLPKVISSTEKCDHEVISDWYGYSAYNLDGTILTSLKPEIAYTNAERMETLPVVLDDGSSGCDHEVDDSSYGYTAYNYQGTTLYPFRPDILYPNVSCYEVLDIAEGCGYDHEVIDGMYYSDISVFGDIYYPFKENILYTNAERMERLTIEKDIVFQPQTLAREDHGSTSNTNITIDTFYESGYGGHNVVYQLPTYYNSPTYCLLSGEIITPSSYWEAHLNDYVISPTSTITITASNYESFSFTLDGLTIKCAASGTKDSSNYSLYYLYAIGAKRDTISPYFRLYSTSHTATLTYYSSHNFLVLNPGVGGSLNQFYPYSEGAFSCGQIFIYTKPYIDTRITNFCT